MKLHYMRKNSFSAPDAKVLIVDDIHTNLKIAKTLLFPYKMEIYLCKSGIDAIEMLKHAHCDLVFMDYKMPVMDGIETTKFLRAMGEESTYYKNVPIIALTTYNATGAREMFLENGFNDFLLKPIDTVRLNTVLEQWIPREKQRRQCPYA